MNMVYAQFFSLFAVIVGSPLLCGQDNSKVFEASVSDQLGSPRVEFNLGSLNAKEKHFLQLKIHNTTDYEFKIAKVVMGCACGGGTLDNRTLPPGGRVTLSLQIIPPSQVVSTKYQQGLFLFDEGGSNLEVRFRYELEGVLSFTSSMAFIEAKAGDSDKEFMVPFVFSEPVSLERLTVQVTGDLKDLNCTIKHDTEGSFVVCRLNERLHEKGGRGSIVLTDGGLGTFAEIPCTISRVPLAKLLPSVIRFASDDKQLERSTAILKIDEKFFESSSTNSKDSVVNITAFDPNAGYSLKYHRMGKGVYRLELSRDSSKAPDSEKLKLRISNGSNECYLDCAIMRD